MNPTPTIYICGPMTGIDGYNRSAFHAAEVRWVVGRLGFEYRGQPITTRTDSGRVVRGSNRGDSCVVVFRPGVHGPVYGEMPAQAPIERGPRS